MRISLNGRIGLTCLLFASACSTTGKFEKGHPGGIVERYEQGSLGAHANIYWFETAQGPVMVDAPLTTTEAKKLRSSLVKPFRIYVTSARPERTGGLQALREGDIPSFTTPAVATEIKDHAMNRLAIYHRDRPGDVPESVEPPSPSIDERTHTIVGDVEIDLLPLGPGESESSLAVYLPKTGELICGDLVTGGEHLDLTWGRSVAWEARIAELKALEPKLVYPGHGTSGGPELLEQTLEYLKSFHAIVAQYVKPGSAARVSKDIAFAIRQQMLSKYPNYGRAELLDKSIPAEYAVQMAALPPPTAPIEGVAQATTAEPMKADDTPIAASDKEPAGKSSHKTRKSKRN
jgi:glyoxylase-like metal-dependent hydrolase (beta-lactamase superfamily II)